MLTLPTYLTIGRLLVLPILLYCLLSGYVWWAFGLYVAGALTDWLDGYLARKLNMVSDFGTFLDPISDKIYVAALLLSLIAADVVGVLGLCAILIILTREFLVSGLREFLGPKGIKMPVMVLAKWKTAVQMVAIAVLILSGTLPYAYEAGLTLLCLAAGLTIITGYQYLKTGLAHMR